MFSSLFSRQPHEPNPQWQALQALRARGAPVLDLTVSNPTAAGLPYPEGIPALLASAESMRYRPSPQGDADARSAIAKYYHGRGRACDPEDLLLTASTSEAYAFLFKLLCDPGDEILIPSPTYPLFDALAELEHTSLVRYPLRMRQSDGQTRWRGDVDFLRSVVSTRSKALILVHPNNPTGHLADAGEIKAYIDFASEYGLALIVDEVFSDYVLGPRAYAPILSEGPLVFTLNGLSKLLALPQLKLGWIHVAGADDAVAEAKSHLEWIADAFLSVNTPVQTACPALLELRERIQGPILERLRANLAEARAAEHAVTGEPVTVGTSVAGHPTGRTSVADVTGKLLRILPPEAGWYVILDLKSDLSDEDFCLRLLREKHVYVHPGHLFGLEDGCHLVLSLLTAEAEFAEGLRRIAALAGDRAHA